MVRKSLPLIPGWEPVVREITLDPDGFMIPSDLRRSKI